MNNGVVDGLARRSIELPGGPLGPTTRAAVVTDQIRPGNSTLRIECGPLGEEVELYHLESREEPGSGHLVHDDLRLEAGQLGRKCRGNSPLGGAAHSLGAAVVVADIPSDHGEDLGEVETLGPVLGSGVTRNNVTNVVENTHVVIVPSAGCECEATDNCSSDHKQ